MYVKYPVVSGAATNAAYTVKYNGGASTATATVDQTSDNGGDWVPLGKWAFTQGGSGQQVSLAENSGGTVVAGAVEIVRDNSGDTNTAAHGDTYTYDADGKATSISDSSPGAAVASYVMGYDQLDRTASVEEDNASGTAVHTTTYGYDPASNLASRTHDGAPSTYGYNDLNQLQTETDKTSSSDPDPQVTGFTYTPAGQVETATKPNGNVVTSTYYANNLPYTVTEDTSGGTLVSSHTYSYDPDGNKSQDTEKLMSADDSGSYLSHTLGYGYDPQDQVTQVTTDGTATESYTHDAEGDVTAQTVGGTATSYNYVLGRMESATAGGATADYNYDPLGRLDTITSGSQTLQTDTYDGFDNLASASQLNTTTGSMDTTSYAYDSLNRMASQTTGAGTTSFSYLGTTGEVASESDPGGVSKTYDYTPSGARLSQDTTGGSGPAGYGYYSCNGHADVEALTGANGTTTATYGYTACGSPVTSMFTGADKNDATASSSSTTQPYSAYRFNAMRWDSTTGSYDMGFRNYDPGLNQFASRDMYNGATQDMGLTADPFTGSAYAFGNGNPVTNIESDGHAACTGSQALYSVVNSCAAGPPPPRSTTCPGPACSSVPSIFNAPPSSPATAGTSGSSSTYKFPGSTCGVPQHWCSEPRLWCGITAPAPEPGCAQYGFDPVARADQEQVYENLLALGGFGDFGPAGGSEGLIGDLTRACGESFTARTKVLLADGKAKPISSLKPGDKVLATNTKTGKTSAETVAQVEVNHDHDLYNLRVKTVHGVTVIHTTSNHMFWDPSLNKFLPASNLKPGEHLKTPDGQPAVVVGGSVPAVHQGWMWDLTVPGNNDHDFYVMAAQGRGVPVLVHNSNGACGVDPALIQKLQESGVKFTPGNVVAAGENADGQVVFLETGNSRAGLTHIIEQHGGQFAQMGIPEEQVPDFVVTAATEGKMVGIQGTRPIFEVEFEGQTRRVAVTVGSNGFVVGANPVGS